jgi:hypothetical protein
LELQDHLKEAAAAVKKKKLDYVTVAGIDVSEMPSPKCADELTGR